MLTEEIISIKDINEIHKIFIASHTSKECRTKRLFLKVDPINHIVGFEIEYPNKEVMSFSSLDKAIVEYNKI